MTPEDEHTYRQMERELGAERARAMFWFPTLEQFVASFPEIWPAAPKEDET